MNTHSTVVVQLREMVLSGELAPGERVTEAELATRLGVSRTPVRQALPALAQEGLLVPAGKRGYSVRAFTTQNSIEAVRVRALLEGFAARHVAEKGVSAPVMSALKACLAEGDALFTQRQLQDDDELRYGQMNARFHALITEAANLPLLESLTDRCNVVPFTAPLSVAFSNTNKERMFDFLFYAHRQHHAIVDAIEAGQGDRAEFLFREHAHTQEQSLMMGSTLGDATASAHAEPAPNEQT
ncbi:MAG: GntR family transcriptional regulator [Pusillimonas sp.]|nr:GntR family transcriptional regulator [Pusillimonas sp.]MBC42092.1 GntR family transcriptional regulator [Pusillimonas sp.]HCP77458.1 GntR family transcriptional regulator [Pusillimonas sp.]|tara:strand:- start:38384 stop:39106 length:723 start_codon:yes stop_codon:yes gene_type:complete